VMSAKETVWCDGFDMEHDLNLTVALRETCTIAATIVEEGFSRGFPVIVELALCCCVSLFVDLIILVDSYLPAYCQLANRAYTTPVSCKFHWNYHKVR
jgi:hypothetical protein